MIKVLPVIAVILLALSAYATGDDNGATHLTDDSSDRKPLQTVVPVYPEKARRERLTGEVEVCFNVDRDGKTSRVAVRRSTHRIFEKPAILAAKASTYYPLAEGQTLSGIKTCRTFRFQLTPVAIEQPL